MMLFPRFRFLIFIIILSTIAASFYMGLLQYRDGDLLRLEKIEEVQHRRQAHVHKLCHFLNLNYSLTDLPLNSLDHFIVDDEHKLIYCYVPKVACTNWKRILLVLRNPGSVDPLSISGNQTHLPNMFKTLNQFTQKEINFKLLTYTKFMFVRNPYERVLSAYRNKLENSYGDYFRVRFGVEIIKNFRSKPSKESLEKGHDVSFQEFLQYIVNLEKQDHRFSFNEHWRPIFDLCLPCHINYDIIGKYETLEDDADFTLWKTGISNYVKFPKREESYKQRPTADIMQLYYKNISQLIHQELYEIYREDFALFEYHPFVY